MKSLWIYSTYRETLEKYFEFLEILLLSFTKVTIHNSYYLMQPVCTGRNESIHFSNLFT